MDTRFVQVIITAGLSDKRQVVFLLECAENVRIEPNQPFEIVQPGCDPVRAIPLPNQVVYRSDGSIEARMVCENRFQSFEEMTKRLRRMTGVVRHLKVNSR